MRMRPLSRLATLYGDYKQLQLFDTTTNAEADGEQHNLIKYIELRNSQLPENFEESVNKNELTQYTATNEQDEHRQEPMKLVLDDQSINYKVPSIWCYLKSGYGVVVSFIILFYFLSVHVFRVLSGKLKNKT
jgi:hypothetical protein